MKELSKFDVFWIGFCVGCAVSVAVIIATHKVDQGNKSTKMEIKR